MSERDRMTASSLTTNGLPVRDRCRQATICQERASWTRPILTDLVHSRLTKGKLKTPRERHQLALLNNNT
jgi:hypothetical protein